MNRLKKQENNLEKIDIIEVAKRLGLRVKKNGQGTFTYCPHCETGGNGKLPHHYRLGGDKQHLAGCYKCKQGDNPLSLIKKTRAVEAAQAYQWLRDEGFLPNGKTHRPESPVDLDGLQELAGIRGWQRAALEKLGCKPDSPKREVHFPMKDAGGDVVGWRRRRSDNRPFGNTRKALTIRGGPTGLIYPSPLSDADPVLVCEGEADAAAAFSAGHEAVVATPGANPSKDCLKYLTLLKGREVIMAPHPGQEGRNWRNLIGNMLADMGCSVSFIIPLAQDLDERLKDGDNLSDLIQSAEGWRTSNEEFFDGNFFIPLRLARKIISERMMRFKYNLNEDGERKGCLVEYKNGIWTPPADLKVEAQRALGEKVRTNRINETMAAMKLEAPANEIKDWDRLPDYFINCRNGLVDLRCNPPRLVEHNPDHLSLSQIPWDYSPDACHEDLNEALTVMFPDDDVLQAAIKLAGYALTPHQRAKTICFLTGDTDTGKTTFIEWLRGLVGPDAYATTTPQTLSQNKFASSDLEGKLLNAPDEMKDLSLKSVESLKSFSGGGNYYRVEHKNRDSYQARLTATLVFACNSLPTITGRVDEAFYKRLLVIPFDHTVKEPDQDPTLRNEWPYNPEIMEAFLAMAVQGLAALRNDSWQFIRPAASESAVRDHREFGDSLTAFINQRAIVNPGVKVQRSVFCGEFEDYCKENNMSPTTRVKVCQRLREEWKITESKSHGDIYIRGIGLSGLGG